MIQKLIYRFCWVLIWIAIAACFWREIQIQLELIGIRNDLRESREIQKRIMKRL